MTASSIVSAESAVRPELVDAHVGIDPSRDQRWTLTKQWRETRTMRLDRRRFLAQAGGTALLSCAPAWASLPQQRTHQRERLREMNPRRSFGKAEQVPDRLLSWRGTDLIARQSP